MAYSIDLIRTVLTHFGLDLEPCQIKDLGAAGGFSGACFWRLTQATNDGSSGDRGSGDLCLRRWPSEHPSPQRLAWIHSVLRHAAAHGFDRLPLPRPTVGGQTWVFYANALWELSPWLAGRADFCTEPNTVRLRGAMKALAQFHRAVEGFDAPRIAPSPALSQRAEKLEDLAAGGFTDLHHAVQKHSEPLLQADALRILECAVQFAPTIQRAIGEMKSCAVALQPCLRDIWHDHVLFEGDQVSGFVDFGAMRIETVAGDLGRLLGSLVGGHVERWHEGMSAYEEVRPLSETERRLAQVFDESGMLLGGVHWIEWIYRQGRQFDDLRRVSQRMRTIAARLEPICGAPSSSFR